MVERHFKRNKLLVRDRIDLLIDPLTPFLELSPLAGWGLYNNGLPSAGIVTGIGTVRGVTCMIIANDATVKGGSFFKETVRKHIRAQDIAQENRLPVVYLVDCGGANLQNLEDVFPDQEHFGGTFYRQCRMSAEGIPQVAAVFGESTAGGAYIPVLCDEFVMVAENSSIHLGGRRRADPHSLVGLADVQRAGIGIGMDRDRPQSQTAAGADDAAGDLAAVGDENGTDGTGSGGEVGHDHIRYTGRWPRTCGCIAPVARHSASTERVSAGAMMPSSQTRAVQ